ncbi:MAG: amino acid ABC transporter permease, partial [Deltaproteobacteria bacterium]|nr:amino acid ABC transporter permease [Deltaproteobacteria bacterium]
MGTWDFYERVLIPALNRGLWLSVKIIIPSALLGVLIGILAGAGRAAGPKWLKKILDVYVSVFRGTPLVVQLFMWYWGIPSLALFLDSLFGAGAGSPFRAYLSIKPYYIAVWAFTLCSGAYHSEYIRGALLSVRRGQILAAESLGMTRLQTFIHVTAPVALRRALPGCGNEIIYLIKYSSLAVLITLQELTGQARNIASLYFRHLESYLL